MNTSNFEINQEVTAELAEWNALMYLATLVTYSTPMMMRDNVVPEYMQISNVAWLPELLSQAETATVNGPESCAVLEARRVISRCRFEDGTPKKRRLHLLGGVNRKHLACRKMGLVDELVNLTSCEFGMRRKARVLKQLIVDKQLEKTETEQRMQKTFEQDFVGSEEIREVLQQDLRYLGTKIAKLEKIKLYTEQQRQTICALKEERIRRYFRSKAQAEVLELLDCERPRTKNPAVVLETLLETRNLLVLSGICSNDFADSELDQQMRSSREIAWELFGPDQMSLELADLLKKGA